MTRSKRPKKEMVEMMNELTECEKELEKWKHLRTLSTVAIKYLKTTKGNEESSLQNAYPEELSISITSRPEEPDRIPSNIVSPPDSELDIPIPEITTLKGPSARIPAPILVKIFKLVLHAEYRDCIENPLEKPLRPLFYVLSHVCRQWYSTVWETPELWTIIYASPRWSKDMKELFVLMTRKAPGRMTVFTELSRSLNVSHVELYNTPHTAHVTIDDEDDDIASLRELKCPTAHSLIISSFKLKSDNPFDHTERRSPVSHMNRNFEAVTSLTLTTEVKGHLSYGNISNLFPCLTNLALQFEISSTGSFPWRWYLAPDLQALYIRSSWESAFPDLTRLDLYRLHTLGIRSNGMEFLQKIQVPHLKRLTLYNPNNNTYATNITYTLGQVENLEFHGWDAMNSTGDNEAVSFILTFTSRRPEFRSVKFTNSIVDGSTLTMLCYHSGQNRIVAKPMKPTLIYGEWTGTLILDHTTGITREQCEAVQRYVGKLEVYA